MTHFVFASPSIHEGETLAQAQAHDSDRERLASAAGGIRYSPGLGVWKDGAEVSGVFPIHSNERRRLDWLAADLGHKLHQKMTAVFESKRGGQDRHHILLVPSKNLQEIKDSLLRHGIEHMTLIPGEKTRVHLLDPGAKLEPGVKAFTSATGSKRKTLEGEVRFIGGNTREEGREAFETVLGGKPKKLARRPTGGIFDWREALNQSGLTPKGTWSSTQYHRNPIHGQFADYLEDNNDPRAQIVRNMMTPRAASLKAATTDSGHNRRLLTVVMGRGGNALGGMYWAIRPAPVIHKFADGTKLAVMVLHGEPPDDRMFHVAWDGPAKKWYNTVMTPEQFHQWRKSFPEPERTRLEVTYNNNQHTQTHDSEADIQRDQEDYARRSEAMKNITAKLARKTPHRVDSPAAALSSSYTVNAQKRREIAEQIVKEAGLHPAAVRTVLAHEQGKGVRSTVLTAIQRRMDPSLAKYVAAWFGLLSREKALTVFTPHDAGHDRLHILASNLPVDEMGNYLGQAGIPKYSVEENGNGSRAFIFSPNGEYDPHVARVSGGLNASTTSYSGTGFRLGSGEGTDADSRAKFRDTISDFERSNSPKSTGPTS